MADEPTAEELSALAGYTVAFFNVTPEMKALLQKAMANLYEPARLQAEIRNTQWYKTTSQTEREAWLLRSSDPAELDRRVQQMRSQILGLANRIGIPLGTPTLHKFANEALVNGYTEDQIRQKLGAMGSVFDVGKKGGVLSGDVGQAQQQINAALAAYGLQGRVTRNSIGGWLSAIAQGTRDMNFVMGQIQNLAISSFPGLADRIKGGETVMDIAQPYIESMGRLLEINPQDVDLNDPKIRQALSHRNKDGQVGPKTVWEFEDDLRKDRRWLATNNARESMMEVATSIGRDFGVVA